MADLDAIIAETQQTLGAIIQKPKLTEPLLKKPPFRFLHDIFSEVHRVSGFPSTTVLSDYDLDSGNFKDKESKIAYLNKVIGAVSDAVGAVAVKPLKIVAGLEPENTNALLQALARAAAGGAPAPEPPKEERRKRAEATLPPQPAEVERPQRAEGRSRRKEEPERELPAPEAAPPPARAPQPERETIQPLDEDRRMDRPRTALRAPPKQAAGAAVKDTRPTSKQDGQQTGRVIAEGDVTDDDEEEHASGALSAQAIPGAGRGAAPQRAGEEGHGMLVKKMLRVESEQIGDAEGEGTGGTGDPEKDRDRKRMADEMARLRESIQMLCKSTNPLARSMDYLQEDLDNMAKELDFWMKDRDEQTLRLEEEERATEVEVDKLYSELQGVEESIKEEELRIKDLKAAALENDKTVKNMLASIVRTNNTR